VHRKDFILNDGAEGEVVKDFRAVPPHIHRTVFPQAFVVESVHLSDLSTFVISADERDAVGIADFECEEEEECFDGIVASVNKVAEE